MDNLTAIKESCFRYFEGKADYRIETLIREFISSEQGNYELFRSWEKDWVASHTPTIPQINSFNKLRSDISERRKRRIMFRSFAAAASVAVLVGLTSLLLQRYEAAPDPKIYVVETTYQERTKVILPDSTQVWLNSASRLSYTDDFMTKNREVQISGEAFFDVVRKNDMPFVVKFQENTITVKGTKFNVTAYGMEDKVYAALVEGKIEFAGSTVKVDMNPGEMLSYDMTTKDILKCRADLSSQISWVDGRLDYSSITLEQFLTRLSSIYGFKVDYRPHKYVNHTFCINLSTNESLNDVLDAISIIVPISWSYSDGVVTVTEK